MWRVHRLDQINAKKPAKLLNSKSLTLDFSRQQIWPVFLCDTAKSLYDESADPGRVCVPYRGKAALSESPTNLAHWQFPRMLRVATLGLGRILFGRDLHWLQ